MEPKEPNLYVSGVQWDEHSIPPLMNRIDCTVANGCTTCCTSLNHAQLDEQDIERLATHLGRSVRRLQFKWRHPDGRYLIPLPCEFLVPGEGCSVYEARPTVCRVFPLQRCNSPEGPRVGVTVAWCEAGRPCIKLLERWQGH